MPEIARTNVRYDPDEQMWYMRCDGCAKYGRTQCFWPLDLEHWYPAKTLQRCRACVYSADRLRKRSIKDIEDRRARRREYYHRNAAYIQARRRLKRALDPEKYREQSRRYNAAARDRKRGDQAA